MATLNLTSPEALDKAHAIIAKQSPVRLVEMFEQTTSRMNARPDSGTWQAIADVRGWIMDALESRNGEAFTAWMASEPAQDSPRAFFLHSTLSNDGSITYSDGYALKQCEICREEHTDIREVNHCYEMPICWYCANDRYPQYQPRSYIGRA